MMQRRRIRMLLLLSAAPLAFMACSNSSGGGGGGWTTADIATRVDGVLKTGLNTIGADAVAALFFDGVTTNDPFVLDTREAADFARGHVPGSVNVPLLQFPQRYADEGTALVPSDRNVVVVSYFGGDGNMACLLINCVRITDPANAAAFPWSKTMMMGMQAWSFDTTLAAGRRYPDDLGTYRVETATETTPHSGGAFAIPTVAPVAADSLERAILERGKAYLGRYTDQLGLQASAVDLQAILNDPNAANDPQVVSVRGAADYAKGHIPGALNLGWKDAADITKVTLLDPARPVVAYCYTGHTGSLATMALGLLGYDVTNLAYGMCGWNPTSAVNAAQLLNFDVVRGWDFPIDNGGATDLGDLAAYTPPSGCMECHSSLTAIHYDLTVDAPAEPDAPPSVGEG